MVVDLEDLLLVRRELGVSLVDTSQDDVSLGSEANGSRPLLHGFHGVLHLKESAGWAPCGHVRVVLVPEHFHNAVSLHRDTHSSFFVEPSPLIFLLIQNREMEVFFLFKKSGKMKLGFCDHGGCGRVLFWSKIHFRSLRPGPKSLKLRPKISYGLVHIGPPLTVIFSIASEVLPFHRNKIDYDFITSIHSKLRVHLILILKSVSNFFNL